MLLFSFLRNSFMHFRILLFPFEFCYSLFWFYYAIMHSLIQFPILLFAFEFCYAVFQFYNLIVQSSHAVSNPTTSFEILIFTFLIIISLCHYYSLSNIMFFEILDFVHLAVGALGTSIKLIKHSRLGRRRFTESITSMGKCDSTASSFTKFWLW